MKSERGERNKHSKNHRDPPPQTGARRHAAPGAESILSPFRPVVDRAPLDNFSQTTAGLGSFVGATEGGLEIPPDFLLVGKALMTMEGIAKELDPTLEVIEEAKPQLIEIVRRRYSPERLATGVQDT